jgi:hypothetical protein
MNPAKIVLITSMALFILLAITLQLTAQQHGNESATTSIANPVPLINQPLVPDALKPGGAGFTLTVNGTGFVSSSLIYWNGSARVTTFVTRSRLKASILSTDITKRGTAWVKVVNPTPGGGISNVASFEITTPTFAAPLSITSTIAFDYYPLALATGDFNGDSKLDLAVAAGNVSVLLGKGNGAFQAPVDYAAGAAPDFVAVGDFNGDGKLDLAVANANSNNVSVLLGSGDGTFQPAVNYDTGFEPEAVAVGDFNGDGKLDLVVVNTAAGNGRSSVSVLLGKGNGTFQPAVNYRAGFDPDSVAVGDFNGDGNLDLAVANFGTNNVSILLGSGKGTFQTAVNYDTGGGSQSVAAGDFNGDGKLDLAVANYASNNVSVLLGNGNGTFQAAANYETGAGPMAVAVGDFNGDGKLDLAVANNGSQDVSILLGNGNGTFQPAENWAAGSNPWSIAAGDFNRNGKLDLAVPDPASLTVSVLLEMADTGAVVELNPPYLNFGGVIVGDSSSQRTTLTNVGNTQLNILGITITGSDPGDFSQQNTCDGVVRARQSCTITVKFTPTQTGVRTANVSVSDNGRNSPQQVSLSGVGQHSGCSGRCGSSTCHRGCGCFNGFCAGASLPTISRSQDRLWGKEATSELLCAARPTIAFACQE